MPLDPELVERIRARAGTADEANEFSHEDLADLRAAGYLRPRSLRDIVRDQRALAAASPATALSVNMHLVWQAAAGLLAARGDDTLDWVMREAEAGELFAFGVSEPGNDLVLVDSLTEASDVPDEAGAVSFHGTKVFTSLGPAWTRLGVHGRAETADGPVIVWGFLTRDDVGDSDEALIEVRDDWDVLGMRATGSGTTVLRGAVADPTRVVRRVAVGDAADPFVFAITAAFLLTIASVYAGIADRALELAMTSLRGRGARHSGAVPADDVTVRDRLARAAIALDAVGPDIAALAADAEAGVAHGAAWGRLLAGAKLRAVETARRVVDDALRVTGGAGYRREAELSRLARDVLAGVYHPSSESATLRAAADSLLGP